MNLNRREFLVAAAAAGLRAGVAGAAEDPRRAVVIGHTGRGDYGHGLDRIFEGRPGIQCVAVVDPDPVGRAAARARLGAGQAYADVGTMLAAERPELASIAMRQADQHATLGLACIRAGVHCFFEKPFTTAADEADELVAEAGRRGVTLAVAHTMRLTPAVQRLKRVVAEGLIGDLVELRAHGKQDSRAGGEDLVVLGTHLFDLFRLFVGDPEWVTGDVRVGDRPATRADRRLVKDNVGWVAGDRVFARFGFARGVHATFTSDARLRDTLGPWGIQVLGSRGAAKLECDLVPRVWVREPAPANRSWDDAWKPLGDAREDSAREHHLTPVADWLEAIGAKREPQCSGRNGAWAVEMAQGVHAASLAGGRVRFPLPERRHPLAA